MIQIFFVFGLLASAITANKFILYSFPPVLFAGIRMTVSGILLLTYALLSTSAHLKILYIKRDFIKIVFIALLTMYITPICKAYALKYLLSSKASLFGTLDPLLTALYSYILFNEKLTLPKIGGLLLGVIGVLVLLLSTSPLEETIGTLSIFSYPELAAIGAVAVSRYGWLMVQTMLKKELYAPVELNGLLMLLGGCCALITSYIAGDFSQVTFKHTSTFYGALAYTIIVGNIIAYTIYASLLKRYSATLVALSGFSVPLFVALYGYLFLNESLHFSFFIALGFIFMGVLVFYRQEYRKSTA